MPQARRGGSRSSGASRASTSSGSRGGRTRSTSRATSRSGGTKSTRTGTKRTGGRAGGRAASGSRRAASARSGAADARLDAAAQRLRRLNERIIAAGKDAGESSLVNYEKALKSIATAIERGPGSSDIEWVSSLATAQAKFIRDVTSSWTDAAKKMLK
jgi:hypothetical protein